MAHRHCEQWLERRGSKDLSKGTDQPSDPTGHQCLVCTLLSDTDGNFSESFTQPENTLNQFGRLGFTPSVAQAQRDVRSQ